jgi:hypothetical protein
MSARSRWQIRSLGNPQWNPVFILGEGKIKMAKEQLESSNQDEELILEISEQSGT